MHRLEAEHAHLYQSLLAAPPERQRRAAQTAAARALAEVAVQPLAGFVPTMSPDARLSSQVASIARRLDAMAWQHQEENNLDGYMYYFSQARAASALAYALDPDTPAAAIEATYEASKAVDDPSSILDAVAEAVNVQ